MPNEHEHYHYDDSGTGWFVGIIVALALLAIGYLVFSANVRPCGAEVCSMNIEAVE